MRALAQLCFMACIVAPPALACTPPSGGDPFEETVSRVKSDFDGARFVVIADIIAITPAKVRAYAESDFEASVERVSFRVVESFKGDLKRGDTFKVDNGVTSCSISIKASAWVPRDPANLRAIKPHPTRWLLYYTVLAEPPAQPYSLPFEITFSSLSRPAAWATYDIGIMKKLAGQWLGANKRSP